MPRISLTDDYAVMYAAGLRFYYGYEVQDQGLWCFSVTQDDDEIFRLSFEQLKCRDMFETAECLLQGIAMWMEHAKRMADAADDE